jgi:hypothetical protein
LSTPEESGGKETQTDSTESVGVIHTIGSAVKAGNAMTAIKEGYEAGFAI